MLFIITITLVIKQAVVMADASDSVESVEVQLNVGSSIYDGLRERMEFSIGRVGEKILLSRSITILKANQASVETAIYKVFSKVLIGFKLERVDLFPGKHSKIIVQLNPNPPFVSEINVDLEINGVSPEISDLFHDIAQLLEEELGTILIGLPVDSLAWSEGIIDQAVHYLVEKEFPGYGCRFSLKSGSKAEFKITLSPITPVIKEVKVNYSSTSFPVWLVKQKAKHYQERFEVIKGLPVEFLKYYQSKLEKYMTDYLNSMPEMDRAGLKIKLGIEAGENTRIKVLTESETFQTKFEARYFINNDTDFGNFQCYLGYKTEVSEIYTQFYHGDYPGGRLKAGFRWPLSTSLTGALEYEFDNHYKFIWLHNQFERGDYFDLRIGMDGSPNEAVIGVFLNDYFNLELVSFDDQFGIQFMFHF